MVDTAHTDGSDQAPAYRKPRRGWERVTVESNVPRRARETLRSDAPSPAQEVLDKADHELAETPDAADIEIDIREVSTGIICF